MFFHFYWTYPLLNVCFVWQVIVVFFDCRFSIVDCWLSVVGCWLLIDSVIFFTFSVVCIKLWITKYTLVYHEYQSVCPLVRIGTPHPLSLCRVCPPRNQRGRGHTRLLVRWWGVPIRTTGEKPCTLSTLALDISSFLCSISFFIISPHLRLPSPLKNLLLVYLYLFLSPQLFLPPASLAK